jgi:hypothetical protein
MAAYRGGLDTCRTGKGEEEAEPEQGSTEDTTMPISTIQVEILDSSRIQSYGSQRNPIRMAWHPELEALDTISKPMTVCHRTTEVPGKENWTY